MPTSGFTAGHLRYRFRSRHLRGRCGSWPGRRPAGADDDVVQVLGRVPSSRDRPDRPSPTSTGARLLLRHRRPDLPGQATGAATTGVRQAARDLEASPPRDRRAALRCSEATSTAAPTSTGPGRAGPPHERVRRVLAPRPARLHAPRHARSSTSTDARVTTATGIIAAAGPASGPAAGGSEIAQLAPPSSASTASRATAWSRPSGHPGPAEAVARQPSRPTACRRLLGDEEAGILGASATSATSSR
jgi:hypothetical protein